MGPTQRYGISGALMRDNISRFVRDAGPSSEPRWERDRGVGYWLVRIEFGFLLAISLVGLYGFVRSIVS